MCGGCLTAARTRPWTCTCHGCAGSSARARSSRGTCIPCGASASSWRHPHEAHGVPMRLRIILLAVAISSMILVSFLVPLALLLRTFQADRAINAATVEAQFMAGLVDTLDTTHLKIAVARANAQEPTQPVTIFMPNGQTLPAHTPRSPGVLLAARGRSLTDRVPGGTEVLVAVLGLPHRTAVIRTFISQGQVNHGVLRAWLLLGGVGLGLIALSVIVSAQLARSLVRPLGPLPPASAHPAPPHLSP